MDMVRAVLHFCSIFPCKHLFLLLNSQGGFHIPCFFLEFPCSCLGCPFFCSFANCLILTMFRLSRWQRALRSSFAPTMSRVGKNPGKKKKPARWFFLYFIWFYCFFGFFKFRVCDMKFCCILLHLNVLLDM